MEAPGFSLVKQALLVPVALATAPWDATHFHPGLKLSISHCLLAELKLGASTCKYEHPSKYEQASD